MFDPNTERMIEYWRGRRGEHALPARDSIDPAGFATFAPRVFIAGESVEELHGRPLKGVELASLWRPAHRHALALALDASLANASPLVIGAHALTTTGSGGTLEILFAPIASPRGVADLILGFYQTTRGRRPIDPPVRELAIRRIDGADARNRPTLRLAAVDGQLIA